MAVATSTLLAVGLGAAIGGAAYGIGAAQNKPKQEAPMPMPEAPKVEDQSVKAENVVDEKRRAMARSKSIYTSPLGIADQANVVKKTLLGE